MEGVGGLATNVVSAAEKEVKKASKELSTQTARMSDLQKIDHLTKRCADLLHEMKKHERENLKNKKRGDQLQKEKDQSRTELSKTIGLKEKLEKLCRELQKENNKLKVPTYLPSSAFAAAGTGVAVRLTDAPGRTRTSPSRTTRCAARTRGTTSTRCSSRSSTTARKRRTTRAGRP